MTATEPTALSVDELTGMLRAWAKGVYCDEAAVALLIGHDCWLRRADFRAALVRVREEGGTGAGGPVRLASIDWYAAGDFLATAPASGSEARMLLLAASLAGATNNVSLAELLTGLDETNARHVLDAVGHCCGIRIVEACRG
jgi:hypothetical protein